MVYFILIFLNLFFFNFVQADTSFAEIYLNKLHQKTEFKPEEPNATTVPPTATPETITKDEKELTIEPSIPTVVEKKAETKPESTPPLKSEEKKINFFKVAISPSIEYFSLKSVDNSTRGTATINSELSSKYLLTTSILSGNNEFSFSYLLSNINFENLPTSSSKTLSNRKQINHSFFSSIKNTISNNELVFSFGIVDHIFVRTLNANSYTLDKINSPFAGLKYRYNFHLNDNLAIAPELAINNNFQSKNNLYSIKNNQDASVGVVFKLNIKNISVGLDNKYFYKKQRSDNSTDTIKGISSGINFAIEF